MVRNRFLMVILAILMLGGVIETLAESVASFPGNQPLIVAWYVIDYTWNTWDETFSAKPDSPYVSSDVLTIIRHISDAKAAGINAFILSWHGAKTTLPSHANAFAVLQQAEKMDLRIAILLDMKSPELDSADDVTDALLLLAESHMQEPAYLLVGGKPVVFFRGQDGLSIPSWQAIRNRVDPGCNMVWIADDHDLAYLEVFDGVFGEKTALSEDFKRQSQLVANEIQTWREYRSTHLLWVGVVMPGYTASGDISQVEERKRSHGTFYTFQWEAARESNADWVFINSYNDWKVGTQIEPSSEYLEAYLTLTALQGDLFRSLHSEESPVASTPEIQPTSVVLPVLTATENVTLQHTPSVTESLPVTVTAQPLPASMGTPQRTPIHLSTPTITPPARAGSTDLPGNLSPQLTVFSTELRLTPTMQRMPLESMPAPKKCFPFPIFLLVVMVFCHHIWMKRS